ncbi:hypothetical protein [Sulfurimonas sp. HSL-1716]|uniref:hypothetical protein n=1 Tax=Hydrocurvibacter sulfurireducens TaxID=3131937 RepID=UPI0031F9FB2D
MKTIDKYSNIEKELPNLAEVLKEALQTDFLDIQQVDKDCEKYKKECERIHFLKNADYVIYSPHVKKENHQNELFVFLDETGKILCHVGGAELELYGLIRPCKNLELSEEYKNSIRKK